MRRLRERDDRGAAAVLVAVLVPLILTGIGFLAVTVGGWYSARAMDQNAADAGAIAVATTCYPGPCDPAAADGYADGSSNGALAGQVSTVCGNFPGLTSCASFGVAEDGIACPMPLSGAPYVDVLTAPPGGSMKNLFGGGTQSLGACAQASVGGPSGCDGCTALTISECEWNLDTNDGQDFATAPLGGPHYAAPAPAYTSPATYLDTITARRADARYNVSGANFYVTHKIYDPRNPKATYTASPSAPSNAPTSGSETVLTTHGFGASCDGASGNAPGQFGWLSNGSCSVIVTNPYPGVTGNSAAPCEAAFTTSRDNATPIYLPVYSSVTGSGSGASYTLDGFAAFVVTGWDVTSGSAGNFTVKKAPSLIALADGGLPSASAANYCGTYTGSPSDVCVYGYFTQALVSAAELTGGGGTDLGVVLASLSG